MQDWTLPSHEEHAIRARPKWHPRGKRNLEYFRRLSVRDIDETNALQLQSSNDVGAGTYKGEILSARLRRGV